MYYTYVHTYIYIHLHIKYFANETFEQRPMRACKIRSLHCLVLWAHTHICYYNFLNKLLKNMLRFCLTM